MPEWQAVPWPRQQSPPRSSSSSSSPDVLLRYDAERAAHERVDTTEIGVGAGREALRRLVAHCADAASHDQPGQAARLAAVGLVSRLVNDGAQRNSVVAVRLDPAEVDGRAVAELAGIEQAGAVGEREADTAALVTGGLAGRDRVEAHGQRVVLVHDRQALALLHLRRQALLARVGEVALRVAEVADRDLRDERARAILDRVAVNAVDLAGAGRIPVLRQLAVSQVVGLVDRARERVHPPLVVLRHA